MPEKARPLLEQSIERLQENAGRIRRIQQSLVIRPLQYGLAVYLEEMGRRFRQQTGITLNLSLPPNLDESLPDHAGREPIYAVWQQAWIVPTTNHQPPTTNKPYHRGQRRPCVGLVAL